MCCSTVPSRDSKMFLSPTDTRNQTFPFHSIKIHRHTQNDNLNRRCILLFILAFSSSVRCSVLVLMTTFTLFTLKTWGNNQNPPSYLPIDGLHIFLWHDTLAPVKKKMSNFCEPLLQIRWLLQFCHFSSPKSPTCSCETESIITDTVRCSVRQCEQLSLRTTLKYRSQTRNVLMHLGLHHWSPGWSEALINVITELLFDRSKQKKGLLLSRYYQAPSDWNCLPLNIWSVSNKLYFKQLAFVICSFFYVFKRSFFSDSLVSACSFFLYPRY